VEEVKWRAPLLGGFTLLIVACAPAARAGATDGSGLGGLSPGDEGIAAATVQRALETATSLSSLHWENPGTGASGTVTPLSTFQIAGGRYCRDYQELVRPPRGSLSTIQGKACRSDEGSWIPVTR
jgi:surface antigen